MCKVSVVIPVYNAEAYVCQCLDSVKAQTLQEIEVICINDGSTDRSESMIQDYILSDQRFSLISQKNGGLSAARNAGLCHAKGKYIIFLDSDDWILSQALEELYQTAEQHELDNLYFNAECFFDGEELKIKHSHYLNYYKRNQQYTGIYSGCEYFKACMEHKDFRPSACLQMLKKEFLDVHSIRFFNGILHEDNLFTIQCMLTAKRVMYADCCYYQRRIRAGSIMTKQRGFQNAVGYFICMRELLKFAQDKDFDSKVWHYLEQFICSIKNNAVSYVRDLDRAELEQELEQYPKNVAMEFYIYIYQESAFRIKASKYDAERKKNLSVKQDYEQYYKNYYENSITFRVGRCLTWLPGKVKAYLKR